MGRAPVKVGQLNQYIGRILKTDPILSDVSVVGEISNLKFHNSGHVYFSLKDQNSRVNCFLPSRVFPQIKCPMEEGMEVVASGYVSVYERGGYYSLNVMDLEVYGIGQLAVQYEELKKKLAAEGLFDADKKKELPPYPEVVAVVTSPTGAAVQDILKIIKGRNHMVNVLIRPVLVQGPAAAQDIASAIDELNRDHPEVDVIITGRGGGSMEELWAFNEEAVARSIYRSKIPVISAVGHETDVTIADFVSDVRAETPTAAAQMAVPDTEQLDELVEYYRQKMTEDLLLQVESRRQKLEAASPKAFASGIQTRIAYEQMNLDQRMEEMTASLQGRVSTASQRVDLLGEILETASPFGILSRGYSIVTGEDGSIVRRAEEMSKGDKVRITTGQGSAQAEVLEVNKEDESWARKNLPSKNR